MYICREVLREQATGYVKALQWILYYYYTGVPSWSWWVIFKAVLQIFMS